MKLDPDVLESIYSLTSERTHRLMKILHFESDRGAILVASAALDEEVGELLSRFLVEDPDVRKMILGRGGIAESFGQRITMARALGAIPPDLTEALDRIRDIRNACAHRVEEVSFKTQKIRDNVNNMEPSPPELVAGLEPSDDPVRERFLFNTGVLSGRLTALIEKFDAAKEALKAALQANAEKKPE